MCKYLSLFATLLAGCASTGTSFDYFATEADVIDFVSRLRDEIPMGTSKERAMVSMKARGFDCELKRNDNFSADRPDGSHGVVLETIEGIDFILCTRVRKSGALTKEITSVAVILDGTTVDDIRIRVTGSGP